MDLRPRCGHKHTRCHRCLGFIIAFGQNTKKSHPGSSPDSNFLKVEEYQNNADLHLPLVLTMISHSSFPR